MSLRSLLHRSLLRCCGRAGGGEQDLRVSQVGSIGREWELFVVVNRNAIARTSCLLAHHSICLWV